MAATALDNAIMERIAFLQEQIRPENKKQTNDTFRLQIEILQSADLEKLDKSILMRKEHLKLCRDLREADRLFAEIDALEWLQRQARRYSK